MTIFDLFEEGVNARGQKDLYVKDIYSNDSEKALHAICMSKIPESLIVESTPDIVIKSGTTSFMLQVKKDKKTYMFYFKGGIEDCKSESLKKLLIAAFKKTYKTVIETYNNLPKEIKNIIDN